jgi:hypothetical protein
MVDSARAEELAKILTAGSFALFSTGYARHDFA